MNRYSEIWRTREGSGDDEGSSYAWLCVNIAGDQAAEGQAGQECGNLDIAVYFLPAIRVVE